MISCVRDAPVLVPGEKPEGVHVTLALHFHLPINGSNCKNIGLQEHNSDSKKTTFPKDSYLAPGLREEAADSVQKHLRLVGHLDLHGLAGRLVVIEIEGREEEEGV